MCNQKNIIIETLERSENKFNYRNVIIEIVERLEQMPNDRNAIIGRSYFLLRRMRLRKCM